MNRHFPDLPVSFHVEGQGSLPSVFPVTELATAAVGTAARALGGLMARQFGVFPRVVVDRRLASFWFHSSLRPQGWETASLRDSVTGDYRTQDGWIRIHANAPHHRAAALKVLGADPHPEAVARRVGDWASEELETALVQAHACAAAMRSSEEWAVHPQGRAVASEPLIHFESTPPGKRGRWQGTPSRPLAGLRVLDLTRVLAGPVATRFLAGYGADVLRIDPPFWNEDGVVPEMTLGKRCARLDLRIPSDMARFKDLLRETDVLVHGYRTEALERLGLGDAERRALRPGLVDVSLNAYGQTGPWRGRRGFDSLVQMSSGIAERGMKHYGTDHPRPLPVQALDHATGYLVAASVIRGLILQLESGAGCRTRLSLAATGALLAGGPCGGAAEGLAEETEEDRNAAVENTAWGPAQRLRPPCEIEYAPMWWAHPAGRLGAAPAAW